MKISTLFYTILQGFRNLFRNKWFSLASIATISACLFLFGLFYAIVANFQSMVKAAQEGVAVTLFFQEGTTEERILEIKGVVEKRIEVSEVRYISAEQAWEDYKATFGKDSSDYAEGFAENPLEGSENLEIFLADVSMQSALVTYLQSIPESRKVNHLDSVANTLSGMNVLIGYVSLGIIVILLAVSVFLISNTVTVGISVRKEEINIMKYIGATDFFVRAPFVLEGMLIGLLGAALPLWLIHNVYGYVTEFFLERFSMLSELLTFLTVEEIFRLLTPVSLGVGVGIGFLGSVTTVRKHLKV
ncbi:MAG: ABC transporter permease [Clostridium sp.]|jgi:cell division transport system permease protein|nr:ABC transporter permease [Clostridium sp.]